MDYSKVLKDDELVLVFQLLPLYALLQARAVCRRWRTLARDPRVWQHRALVAAPHRWSDCQMSMVALCVAPRVRSVTLCCYCYESSPSSLRRAVLRAECTVEELTQEPYPYGFGKGCSCSTYALTWLDNVLQRQVELSIAGAGLLRKVALREVHPARAVRLLELVLRAKLDELELMQKNYYGQSTFSLSEDAASGMASLRSLRYDSRREMSFPALLVLQPLLRAHAATLESVEILSMWYGGGEDLLGKCPKLRRLWLSACRANAAVLNAVPAAQIVDFSLTGPNQSEHWDLEAFLPFFRAATALRRLSLSSADYILEEVFALAESTNSCLEELSIWQSLSMSWRSLINNVQKLLPHLRLLSLGGRVEGLSDADDLLGRTCAPVMPNLHVLHVKYPCWKFHGEVVVSCGLPTLYDMVRRNPQLHVVGLPSERECSSQNMQRLCGFTECECCEKGLHPAPAASAREDSHYSLCGHGEGEQCGLRDHRARTGKCPCGPSCELPHKWVYVPQLQVAADLFPPC